MSTAVDTSARTAGRVLAAAFVDDPVMRWLVPTPDDAARTARLRHLFGSFAATASRTPGARLLATPDGVGAALWLPPGGWHASAAEQARTFPRSLLAVRTAAVRALRVEAVTQRAHPRQPEHWYLHAVGVVPGARGQGLGLPLLRPVLEQCDRDGLPAYLESSNPRNRTFYARLGFTPTQELPVPAGCPSVLGMWREPGAG